MKSELFFVNGKPYGRKEIKAFTIGHMSDGMPREPKKVLSVRVSLGTWERAAAWESSVRFPGHKRGRPRAFKLDARLRALLKEPRGWSRRAWKAATAKLGVPDLRPHDLRHTAATRAFLAGATVAEVQELLGHRSPEMAQRLYTHLFPREMEAVRYSWGGVPVRVGGRGPEARDARRSRPAPRRRG